jgi:colanic acid biosynthesis glycosyl transferase WcaI
MARIAFISQFYNPEPCAAANRVSAMAAAFAAAGNEVRVYTAMPSFPNGVIAPGYRDQRYVVERDGDVTVERVWTYLGKHGRPGNRALHWLAVAAAIALRISRSNIKYELIVVSSPPITLAFPALLCAFIRRIPLLVDVRDVFPEIAVKMGAWKATSPITAVVGTAADLLYRNSRLITCVTETARTEIIARGVEPQKVLLAPNGFDELAPATVAPYLHLEETRDVVFVGNMGLATGLDVVVDAASLLRDDRTIRFVLIGAGVDLTRLQARANNANLTNIVFTGSMPRAEALRALAECSVTVVPLVPTILDSLPTKLFDAMLVGTPIVVSAAGEAKNLVERADVGLAVEPGNPEALVAALRRIRS